MTDHTSGLAVKTSAYHLHQDLANHSSDLDDQTSDLANHTSDLASQTSGQQ
jgi:hypothetical protein